jgi:hypothetical protein
MFAEMMERLASFILIRKTESDSHKTMVMAQGNIGGR